MIDQCLPAPGSLRDDWMLWVELWLHAARRPELRPTAARLYARMHAWFARDDRRGRRQRRVHGRRPRPDRRPPAGADRRLRHPRADRRPGDAARARPRRDLGRDRRPSSVTELIASARARSAPSARGPGPRASSRPRPRRRPSVDTVSRVRKLARPTASSVHVTVTGVAPQRPAVADGDVGDDRVRHALAEPRGRAPPPGT